MKSLRACIFGASGGVGRAIVERLAASGAYACIYACSRTAALTERAGCVVPVTFDLTDEASIKAVAERAAADGPVDLVIVATGILHADHGGEKIGPEKSWSALDPAVMARVFAVNCIGPGLIAKHMLPVLPKDRRAVFAALSARVGSIGDNRLGGWHSYRASKAALNMLIRNFAIEFGRRNSGGVVVSLHPGTVDTGLSRPFQRNVPDGNLLSPEQSADQLLTVIGGLSPEQSGGFFAWDGQEIIF